MYKLIAAAHQGVDTAAYNSSKSALVQLARSLAAAWGCSPKYPLIRVNTLSPGYIPTPMTEGALKESNRRAEWSGDNMMNRLSTIEEMRGPILYLLSDASSFMTAADLVVDGGHISW
jgi:NAD(P)-dependent dehydrogenase (short-subunit alcohol dehydrogenase family)